MTVMKELESIRRLVGQIDKEQLRYVDCFIGTDIGLFMPAGGACFYALTPLHSHPSYMFILPFNDQTSLQMDGKTITAIPGLKKGLIPKNMARYRKTNPRFHVKMPVL